MRQFPLWHFPEIVDIATIATGLGVLLSDFSFVEKSIRVGEVTEWSHSRRSFLDQKAMVYTFAIAAWIRNEAKPKWSAKMRTDVRGPLKKALKYLQQTNDSFFQAETAATDLLNQPQENWLRLAASGGNSQQIIAIRKFSADERRTEEQASILANKLKSDNLSIVLNAIWAAEQTGNRSPEVIDQIRELVVSHDDNVRAKAIMTLAILGEMDEETVDRAAGLLGTGGPYLDFAAAFSLSSLPAVPDHVLLPMNKGMLRALQGCHYELVAHFVNAFDRWIDEPEEYFTKVLAEDGPEYLEIVLETLEQNRKRFVQLNEQA